MTLHINDAGTWRTIHGVYVNDNGTWREIQEVYVNDNGVWRSVFVNDVISLSDASVSHLAVNTTATATYQLTNTGDILGSHFTLGTLEDIGDWIAPKTNMARYECRATPLTGTLSSGTTGAWQNLSTTRGWSVQAFGVTNAASFTLEIRRASDGTVLDSATITLEALSAIV